MILASEQANLLRCSAPGLLAPQENWDQQIPLRRWSAVLGLTPRPLFCYLRPVRFRPRPKLRALQHDGLTTRQLLARE